MLFTAYLQLLFESGKSELEIVPVVGLKKKKKERVKNYRLFW